MPIVTAPISTLTNGVVATNGALTAVDISTAGENATVTTLGGVTVGDGNGGTFYLAAGSARTVDSGSCLNTSSTGRWIRVDAFSGILTTGSMTGYNETFALLSGAGTQPTIVYALPITANVLGKLITVKTCTTGVVTLRGGNATDAFMVSSPTSPLTAVTSLTSTATGGQVWNFIAPYAGRYYEVDKVGAPV